VDEGRLLASGMEVDEDMSVASGFDADEGYGQRAGYDWMKVSRWRADWGMGEGAYLASVEEEE
jgi:hypothetical protein